MSVWDLRHLKQMTIKLARLYTGKGACTQARVPLTQRHSHLSDNNPQMVLLAFPKARE